MKDIDFTIFEVGRNEYKGFVDTIKPECKDVKVEDWDENHIITKIYSKKTGKFLCGRVTTKSEYELNENEHEKYYIYEMPDNDERCAPTPIYQLKLETKEEVQALFDFIAANKEK